jgi:hypothetical protein
MKFSDTVNEIVSSYKSGVPVFIWGPPGVGKSSAVKEASDILEIDIIDQRTCTMEPVDVRGFPEINGDKTKWKRPEFMPTDGHGILFLDELPQAPIAVMNALSQLVLDRRVGEHILPDGWKIIAAGNRMSDRAATNRLPSHVASRFYHVGFEVDFDEWMNWALTADGGKGIRPEITAFLRFRPKLLNVFGEEEEKSKNNNNNNRRQTASAAAIGYGMFEYAFPCPRSWHFLSKRFDAGGKGHPPFEVICGAIGSGAASEFIGFLKLIDKLPQIDAILLDPAKAKVPDDPAALYAVAEALSRRATDVNIGGICIYIERLPAEFSVVCMKNIVKINNKITATDAFTKWSIKHSHVMS